MSVNISGNIKDLLNNLLSSNDTSGALYAIDNIIGNMDSFVSDDNQTDASEARTELKGMIINVLDGCSKRMDNYDQLGSTTKSVDAVTNVRDETTADSRVSDQLYNLIPRVINYFANLHAQQTAAEAIGSCGDKVENLAEGVPLDKVTEMATSKYSFYM